MFKSIYGWCMIRLTVHIALKIMDISEKKYLYLLVITIHVVGVIY